MPSAVKAKYKCAYCSRSFPRPAALGSHVYRSHPEHRKATAKPVSPATKTPAITGPPGKALTQVSPSTSPNPALTHLDGAISGLGKEVEADKQDLTRLEALQRGLAKKEALLAGLIKERTKFVGQE